MIKRHTLKRNSRVPASILGASAIGAAIAHLPEALRWVLMLGEEGGLSTNEIASLAGVSPKTIESTQNRGIALVQRELLLNANAAW